MAAQIYIKTDRPLRQVASEMCKLLALPPFTLHSLSGEPYYQFEMFGILALLRPLEEDERDPEVCEFPYCLNLQMSFGEHELDTDALEYKLQPYYAQMLAFHLNLETAYQERQKAGAHWQIRYQICRKNPRWSGTLLYGEPGWEPAISLSSPRAWRRFTQFP
jgi:hypothetical protein